LCSVMLSLDLRINHSHTHQSVTKITRVVGPKGQVVIPKEIRDQTGLVEGAEVIVGLRVSEVVLRRSSPLTESYVDYFTTALGEKTERRVETKKIIEEEVLDRSSLR
jgi:AbrB family looped-hinge helix DNA binding protein